MRESQSTSDPLIEGSLTGAEREALERHFEGIAEILRRHEKPSLSGGWKVLGQSASGRKLVHLFKVSGYFA